MGVEIKNSSLVGLGVGNFPEPNEKQGKMDSADYIEGTRSVRFGGKSPLTATYDSRPEPGDNEMGATRPKGNSDKG